MSAYTCPRCNGTGRHSFNLMHGTICYGCRGSGTVAKKPPAPTPKWAVFGQHRATGKWLRLYNVTAKTAAGAIEKARTTYANASTDWRDTYTLAQARAMRWTDMADVQALTWDEAQPITGPTIAELVAQGYLTKPTTTTASAA